METLFEIIYSAIDHVVAKRIANKIARVFNIEEDTTSWRNIHFVVSIVVVLVATGMILLLLYLLAKQHDAI